MKADDPVLTVFAWRDINHVLGTISSHVVSFAEQLSMCYWSITKRARAAERNATSQQEMTMQFSNTLTSYQVEPDDVKSIPF